MTDYVNNFLSTKIYGGLHITDVPYGLTGYTEADGTYQYANVEIDRSLCVFGNLITNRKIFGFTKF